MSLQTLFQILKGGAGSGNIGHAGGSGGKGNPGGSAPNKGVPFGKFLQERRRIANDKGNHDLAIYQTDVKGSLTIKVPGNKDFYSDMINRFRSQGKKQNWDENTRVWEVGNSEVDKKRAKGIVDKHFLSVDGNKYNSQQLGSLIGSAREGKVKRLQTALVNKSKKIENRITELEKIVADYDTNPSKKGKTNYTKELDKLVWVSEHLLKKPSRLTAGEIDTLNETAANFKINERI